MGVDGTSVIFVQEHAPAILLSQNRKAPKRLPGFGLGQAGVLFVKVSAGGRIGREDDGGFVPGLDEAGNVAQAKASLVGGFAAIVLAMFTIGDLIIGAVIRQIRKIQPFLLDPQVPPSSKEHQRIGQTCWVHEGGLRDR
jgi:hypothetical protein